MEYLESDFFLIALTFGVYFLAKRLQARTGWVVLNPILLAILALIGFLKVTGISYETYAGSASIIDFWLKPAIVALGVPLYLQLKSIRRQLMPVLVSQLVGCFVGIVSVVLTAKWMGASDDVIISLAPKSVTTPIAMAVTESLNGIPSLFIRLAGCNLRCTWKTLAGNTCECDTAYAAFKVENSFSLPTREIIQIIGHNRGNIDHLVITGGEPFLQADKVRELCLQLKKEAHFHITVETNATLYVEECAQTIDFFSLSPKLSGSVPPAPHMDHHNKTRINIPAIQSFITHARKNKKDFQLKFVYSGENDVSEIQALLRQLDGWANEDILLMPMGATPEELNLSIPKTLEHCIRNGWRFCDRLHISLFGNKQGV